MTVHQPFTVTAARLFDGSEVLAATHLRVAEGRIDAIGGSEIIGHDDALISGGTLLPGLIDAHVHLLPGCTQLAATFGVTTVIDQFSKPDVIDSERAAIAAALAGAGPARADLRTSSIGATAPNGHPTMAYAPIPYVTGPGDAPRFVEARIAEGATHLKVIYDDGSGAMLNIASLDPATIEALVIAAHRHGLPVVAHVSTAAGAVTVARCGVDVLAHVPFERMREAEVRDVAQTGVALIATLSLVDGFPNADGGMPLLGEPGLAARLSPRWRRVLDGQSRRWMPPPPDGAAARENTLALFQSGVRVLAGTDAPNPGLVFGASLHRELQHLVDAGLPPTEALRAATATPADVFEMPDRGRLRIGSRADIVLVDGDPTADITATQHLRTIWVAGRDPAPETYSGSTAEREAITALRETTNKIVAAIQDSWPDFPTPEDVHRDDGELLGRLIPTSGGWQATTTFGAALGAITTRDEAFDTVLGQGLAALAETWWVQPLDARNWHEATLVEVEPDRLRLRWKDPMVDQPPSGQWYHRDDINLSRTRPDEPNGS